MLSLFSVPRAFIGHQGVIQHNALGSWTRLEPRCEIIIFGDDPGVAEAAASHGARHEPVIARNEFGTPILSDIFARMDAVAQYPILGYVNADIVLLDDFLSSVRAATQGHKRFLIVSSRFDSRIERLLPFDAGWDPALRAQARRDNRMYPAGGSDVFVYPRGLYQSMPPFAIGRGYWDNWLMYEARRRHARFIDATATLTAVHQDHTYDHVAAVPAGSADAAVYGAEEGRRNLALAGGHGRLYTVFDAGEILTADGRLLSTWRIPLVYRRVKASVRRALRTFAPRIAAGRRAA